MVLMTDSEKPVSPSNSASPISDLLAATRCRECWDTALRITGRGVVRCKYCEADDDALSTPAVRLAVAVWELQDAGQRVDAVLFHLARLLALTTSERPLTIEALASHFRLSDRQVKSLTRTLRREWLLPIGSSRQQPAGLYWILSPKDFFDWSRAYRSQAIDELATYYRLQRRNFPELAGQTSLFLEQINDELKEALRDERAA